MVIGKIASCAIALSAAAIAAAPAQAVSIGQPAPGFSLLDENNQARSLDEFKGKVVFLNFWASWCAPCRKELPLLADLQKKHADAAVVAINIDSERESADAFLNKLGLEGLVFLFDGKAATPATFGAKTMPQSYVIDTHGVVRKIHYGFKEKTDPEKWIEDLERLAQEAL